MADDAQKTVEMTHEAFAAVCDRLAEGEPLRRICRHLDMPSKSAFYRYLEDDDLDEDEKQGRIARYARARKLGFDAIADETMDIADDGTNDFVMRANGNGDETEVLDHDHIQRSKLRIETRLKLLAKWDPKRYGDKLDVTSSDGSMSPPKSLAEFYAKPE